jgi:CRISPR-associated endonuclease/helicase Cas3
MTANDSYDDFFAAATDRSPFPYQRRLASTRDWPVLLDIPTGLGKTAAVILAWLWRRRFDEASTPKRLVYCLPMRVLGEQTRDAAQSWVQRLETSGWLNQKTTVHLIMGGELDVTWSECPEHDAVIIGTQDQLLSRALNRGYAMSRYAWPTHFAWLNDDTLWVADEVQLMGVGATTMAQMAGFRRKWLTWGPNHSLWMSATLDDRGLATVDFQPPDGGFSRFGLDDTDHAHAVVAQRTGAGKAITRGHFHLNGDSEKQYIENLSRLAWTNHRAGTLTLVIVNRVARAQAVYKTLTKLNKDASIELALVHARMRPLDRARHEAILLKQTEDVAGRIVVATQAVEAGVDVSACTLITELAPWSSLVQRFGRCNRYGEQQSATIIWVDIEEDSEKLTMPYDAATLARARQYLIRLDGEAGPAALRRIVPDEPREFYPVLRSRDLLDLFNTAPDLDGEELDVSRYIRDADDNDCEVAWRQLEASAPSSDIPFPSREERCRVGLGALRGFLKKTQGWVWDPNEAAWRKQDERTLRPGLVIIFDINDGGYHDALGWTGNSADKPSVLLPDGAPDRAANDDRDTYSARWLTLADHTNDVVHACESLLKQLQSRYNDLPWQAFREAARFHDWGKAHPAFQSMLGESPSAVEIWAKSGESVSRNRPIYRDEHGRIRHGFRHEVASALAYLQIKSGEDDALVGLTAYLIASHHGKVRTILRPAPRENPPVGLETLPFARGVCHGDNLLPAVLGKGLTLPALTLDLSAVQLGDSEYGPSWSARSHALLREYGPFRLAVMEALLRAGDARGSAAGRGEPK